MATTSSIGIGSRLDISSNITQLVAIERRPLTRMQHEATSLQTRLPARCTAPDRQMASLTGLSNHINQQFGSLNNNRRVRAVLRADARCVDFCFPTWIGLR